MEISKFLSKVIGIYLIIISLALMLNIQEFKTIFSPLLYDRPLMLVTGFFTVILGLCMVVSHNIWQWNWRVIVTLICWITLLKGLSILFYPTGIDRLTLFFIQHTTAIYIVCVINFILGVLLIYFGFRRD